MTNLEFACRALREHGHAGAAQLLESRSDDDWRGCRQGAGMNPFSEYEHPLDASTILNRTQNWECTPEKAGYWESLFHELGGVW